MRRVAIVTGGAKRIGKTIATTLARHGFDLALHYHQSHDKAQQLASDLMAQYAIKVKLIQADLNNEADATKLMNDAIDYFGHMDLLVNNASCFLRDDAFNSPSDIWQKNMMVNLRAPFVLAQLFAAQQREGLIVNMLDSKLENLTPFYSSYTVAKQGLYTLTKTLAQSYAPLIRVNGIGPGFVLAQEGSDEKEFDALVQTSLSKKAVDPQEIADTIIYMLQMPSLTGQMIMLDGGLHLC